MDCMDYVNYVDCMDCIDSVDVKTDTSSPINVVDFSFCLCFPYNVIGYNVITTLVQWISRIL